MSDKTLGSTERPLKVAVIGSGPSGFYAAAALMRTLPAVEVDMFDRLPAPFGLVRYGVAPDHPKIKNVIKVYEKEAADPRFAFYGNVNIGRDVSVDELRQFYDALIFANGAETDRPLGVPGENLVGSYTATEFVGWYNGHPDYQDRVFDLSHPAAVVIGLGNVAMDVARILAKTVDELKSTDITQKALDVLAESRIKEIHIVGRRGPVQSAFTPVEIKEFGELADSYPVVDKRDLVLNPASQIELNDTKYPVRKKNFEILEKYASESFSGRSKKVIFHFLKSPIELKGAAKLESVVLEKNELSGEANSQSAKGTGIKEELPCGILFRSVGYRGVALPGIPFDSKKGIFPNQTGRITENGQAVPGLYTAGWIKRGPSGIIGTNKPDSEETVSQLIADLPALRPCAQPSRARLKEFLDQKGIRFVSFDDWRQIDAAEIKRGQPLGKPREKFTSVAEMLACLK